MDAISRLLVDLGDLYGRTIPGAVVLIGIYLLFHGFSLTNFFRFKSSVFYNSKMLFAIIFIVASFIIGHIPLFFYHHVESSCRKCPSQLIKGTHQYGCSLENFVDIAFEKSTIRKVDPTRASLLNQFYHDKFRDSSLNDSNGEVILYCKHYLLYKFPQLYNELRGHDAQRNLRGGMAVALAMIFLILICRGIVEFRGAICKNWKFGLHHFIILILLICYLICIRNCFPICIPICFILSDIVIYLVLSLIFVTICIFAILSSKKHEVAQYMIVVPVLIILSLSFLKAGLRSQNMEDAMTLRLYYHVMTDQQKNTDINIENFENK